MVTLPLATPRVCRVTLPPQHQEPTIRKGEMGLVLVLIREALRERVPTQQTIQWQHQHFLWFQLPPSVLEFINIPCLY